MTTRACFISTLIGTAALVLLAGGFSLYVDPYDLHYGSWFAGSYEVKPKGYRRLFLLKAAQFDRLRPTTIIAGNSRVDIGFDPDSPLWPVDDRPVYNYGIPGIGMAAMVALLEKRVNGTSGCCNALMVGLDFIDFLSPAQNENIRSPSAPSTTVYIHKIAENYFSWSAVTDSLWTIREQSNPNAPTVTPHGFNPLRQYNDLVREEGHYAIARQKIGENLKMLRRLRRYGLAGIEPHSAEMAALRRLLMLARTKHLQLILFTYPYHAELLESFRTVGVWDAFEDWKREITGLVARHNATNREAKVTLWDFSGYSDFTTEPIPRRGDRHTRMRWYWEPGHFKATLGEEMLKRMFESPPKNGNAKTAPFGVLLTPATLSARLAEVRRMREVFASAHSTATNP